MKSIKSFDQIANSVRSIDSFISIVRLVLNSKVLLPMLLGLMAKSDRDCTCNDRDCSTHHSWQDRSNHPGWLDLKISIYLLKKIIFTFAMDVFAILAVFALSSLVPLWARSRFRGHISLAISKCRSLIFL